jgi:hypothetical protein
MQIPFLSAISEARSLLIAGAGGGFDIVSGIPIYLFLRSLGKQVVLGNLSFTPLPFTDSEEVFPGTFRITEQSTDVPYFPEKYILDWLDQRNERPEMYGFSNRLGVAPLSAAYSYVVNKHDVDTLILVDGGTDSLMFGDESKVGTIVEDACSIVAASRLSLERTFLAAIGFGVEHELNHHACLENISMLIKSGDYMGAISLTGDMAEGASYLDLVSYLNQKMTLHESIVTNSIASALRGEFGDFHATRRTKGSTQFVSALMGLFWFFRLSGVSSNIRFAPSIEGTQTMDEVARAFQKYRLSNSRRTYREIPL